MKLYIENYKFLRKELKHIFYLSISLIFFIEFIGFSYDEIFPKANIFGNIILRICYSYISALIFYYLVVHHKRQDEKRKFYQTLYSKLNSIVLEHDRIYSQISKINKIESIDYSNEENLKDYLKNVNPHSQYDGIMYVNLGVVSWLKHLYIVAENTNNDIEKLFLQSFLLDVDLINILDSIKNNFLFSQVKLFNHITISNQDFEVFAHAFYNYTITIENLKKYINKEITKYVKNDVG